MGMKKKTKKTVLFLTALVILAGFPLAAGAEQQVSGSVLSFEAPDSWYTYSNIDDMPGLFGGSFEDGTGMFAMAATELPEEQIKDSQEAPCGFIMTFGIPFPASQKEQMPPGWQEMMIQQYSAGGALHGGNPRGGRLSVDGLDDFGYIMLTAQGGEEFSFVPAGSAMGMSVGFVGDYLVYFITFDMKNPQNNEAFLKKVTKSIKSLQ